MKQTVTIPREWLDGLQKTADRVMQSNYKLHETSLLLGYIASAESLLGEEEVPCPKCGDNSNPLCHKPL